MLLVDSDNAKWGKNLVFLCMFLSWILLYPGSHDYTWLQNLWVVLLLLGVFTPACKQVDAVRSAKPPWCLCRKNLAMELVTPQIKCHLVKDQKNPNWIKWHYLKKKKKPSTSRSVCGSWLWPSPPMWFLLCCSVWEPWVSHQLQPK